jgi:acetyl esterase/lipase
MAAGRQRGKADIYVIFITASFVVAACDSAWAQSAVESAVVSGADESATTAGEVTHLVVLDDIRYREGASDAWRLDLAMPEYDGAARRPAIVIVHGGGWRAGSKRDRPYRVMLLEYALKGYVTVSVDYRLVGEAPFPACIEDVKCAVRWLRAHADEYGVDPDRIGTYGHSAGAHLAMMLALCPSSAGMEGDGGWDDFSSAVTAAAGGATPTSLGSRFADGDRYSPLNYVSGDGPPILLLHGTDDDVVSVESIDAFEAKLKEAGAKDISYVRVDGGNHGTAYEHFMSRTSQAMSEFFDRTLRNGR